ncbi:hypothetical protein [Falsiroseomonas sp. HW251]|uniref:hypothetical protein n=1 Tax=Falsiroseomonas sp. HW251 TaxID=3390998 RepID=UPI003D319095
MVSPPRLLAAVIGAVLLGSAVPAAAAEITLRATRPGRPPVVLRAEPADATWRIRVLDANGRAVQRIEAGDPDQGRPGLRDADGDGAQDLWVPSMVGNANTEYELWRMDPATGRFVPAGTISGFQFRRDGAWLVAMARNGCCETTYAFHRFSIAGTLVPAFSIGLRYAEDGKVESCEAAAEADQPDQAARRRWCAVRPDGALPGRGL